MVHDIMKQKATKSNQHVEINNIKGSQSDVLYNIIQKNIIHKLTNMTFGVTVKIVNIKHRNNLENKTRPILANATKPMSGMSGMSSALAHCKVVQCHATKKPSEMRVRMT